MKKVKINGKLKLNKEVVSHLNAPQMHGIKGGDISDTACMGEKTRLRCDGDNTLSWGEYCTNMVECEVITKGLFCRDR